MSTPVPQARPSYSLVCAHGGAVQAWGDGRLTAPATPTGVGARVRAVEFEPVDRPGSSPGAASSQARGGGAQTGAARGAREPL
jgi:hypothetical protein